MIKIKIKLKNNSYYVFLQHDIFDKITTFHKKYYTDSKAIIITDHNVQETLSITDRAYLLFEGDILKDGTAEELAADDQVRRVYLGQNFELRRLYIFTL